MNTPWGASQHQHKIAEGIYEVDTAGHGGILVKTDVAQRYLSDAAIEEGDTRMSGWLAYEEDCDWAIFAYEQPALYAAARARAGCSLKTPEETKQGARETLQSWKQIYLLTVEPETPYYTLLVSNYGWVVNQDEHLLSEQRAINLFSGYVRKYSDEQVSLWCSDLDDPIKLYEPAEKEETV